MLVISPLILWISRLPRAIMVMSFHASSSILSGVWMVPMIRLWPVLALARAWTPRRASIPRRPVSLILPEVFSFIAPDEDRDARPKRAFAAMVARR